MVRIKSTIPLILLMLISGCSDQGERSSASSSDVSLVPQEDVIEIKARNIDLEVKKISREDTLYSVWRVIDAIKEALPQKDPYESRSEYQARIKDFKHKVLFDDVSLDKNLIFELDHQYFKYDPESKSFKYRTYLDSTGDISRKYHSLKVGDRDGLTDSKTLSAMGYWRQSRGVEISNRTYAYIEDEKLHPELSNVVVEYKAEPGLAKKISGKLKVYVVGVVKYPYYKPDSYSPFGDSNIMASVHVLPFTVRGIWLVNEETGDVLSKSYRLTKI